MHPGSAVGGIPELLDVSELVPAGDSSALAAKIQEVLRDPLRIEVLSGRNLAVALEFRDGVLARTQAAPGEHVRDATHAWKPHKKPISMRVLHVVEDR